MKQRLKGKRLNSVILVRGTDLWPLLLKNMKSKEVIYLLLKMLFKIIKNSKVYNKINFKKRNLKSLKFMNKIIKKDHK